jgi:hypothetical protein
MLPADTVPHDAHRFRRPPWTVAARGARERTAARDKPKGKQSFN